MSLSAIHADRDTEEGLKSAAKLFQRAGGIFALLEERKYVADNLDTLDLCVIHLFGFCFLFLLDSSHDFASMTMFSKSRTIDSFAMLMNIMLAQGQACVYEMAVLKNSSPSTLGVFLTP